MVVSFFVRLIGLCVQMASSCFSFVEMFHCVAVLRGVTCASASVPGVIKPNRALVQAGHKVKPTCSPGQCHSDLKAMQGYASNSHIDCVV